MSTLHQIVLFILISDLNALELYLFNFRLISLLRGYQDLPLGRIKWKFHKIKPHKIIHQSKEDIFLQLKQKNYNDLSTRSDEREQNIRIIFRNLVVEGRLDL